MNEWAPEEADRSSGDRWVNPKKWPDVKEDGKTIKRFRFRVLSPVSTGVEWWGEDGKPGRAKDRSLVPHGTKFQPSKFNPGKFETPKDIWAFVVLDVDADTEKVWTVTQATIRNALKAVTAEWGSPFDYDLVCKQGKASDGKIAYSMTVHPSGKAPLGEAQAARWNALKAAGFDLEALWTGGDPFPSAPAASDSGANAGSSDDLPF